MAENRPYRAGLETEHILRVLAEDVPDKFDQHCFAALTSAAGRWGGSMPQSTPAPAKTPPVKIPVKLKKTPRSSASAPVTTGLLLMAC